MNATSAQPHVLIVDDNPADVNLLEFAFEANALPVRIDKAGDGLQAQQLLGSLADQRDCPQLILLDLNMPRANGFEVLKFLSSRGLCRQTAVVVLTTSDTKADRERCVTLGARAMVTKPTDVEGLLALVKSLERYLKAA
jgi:CheY-like chemotaxis protein